MKSKLRETSLISRRLRNRLNTARRAATVCVYSHQRAMTNGALTSASTPRDEVAIGDMQGNTGAQRVYQSGLDRPCAPIFFWRLRSHPTSILVITMCGHACGGGCNRASDLYTQASMISACIIPSKSTAKSCSMLFTTFKGINCFVKALRLHESTVLQYCYTTLTVL